MKYTALQYSTLIVICFLGACSGGDSTQTPAVGSQQDVVLLAPVAIDDGNLTQDDSSPDVPDSVVSDSEVPDAGQTPVTDGTTDGGADPLTVDPDPVVQESTRVSFDITVPAYVSDALQVRLNWGDKEIAARWVIDELWTASVDFSTNTEHLLVVTFYDRNGDIVLASFEQNFKTGASLSESYQITADQFDTSQWDSDSDGFSNLDELLFGTNPLVDDIVEPVQAALELVADKTFRISWQPSASAQFYRVLENPDGVSGFTPISGDLEASIHSVDHRVALYSRVNARYIVQACNAVRCVDSDEQIVVGSLQRAMGYFKASNTDAGDLFGRVILSADGNTLAIGAMEEDSAATGINGNQNNNSADGSGAVYVFARNTGGWIQEAYLKASNTGSGDEFGRALSLSADGNTLAIGATVESSAATGVNGKQNDNSAYWSGAVYMFERNNGHWQQQAYLKASNTNVRDEFGRAVSLSADGNTLAVGAPYEASAATGINGNQNDNSSLSAGAVYVFVRIGENWQQEAYVKASNTDKELVLFGEAVSLSADGNTLAIGAYGEDSAATGIDGNQGDKSAFQAGAVYVFVRVNGNWRQQSYLKASNTNSFDFFGGAVSLSADGNTLVVGASGEDSRAISVNGNESDNTASGSGAVYVFSRINGVWQQQAYLKASNAEAGDSFGQEVSLSGDGNTLAILASGEKSAATGINGNQYDNSIDRSGAIYTFVRIGGNWQQRAYLKASNNRQGELGFIDSVGVTISLSADGNTLAFGALRESSNATGINASQSSVSAPDSGAVYLY